MNMHDDINDDQMSRGKLFEVPRTGSDVIPVYEETFVIAQNIQQVHHSRR